MKAVVNEQGNITLLEQIRLSSGRRVIVTILDDEPTTEQLRPFGLCAGEFMVPDDFDEPLPDSIIQAFEGK
ncbi:MAG: type II toxin-antitoxin system Phd/YefM family antitoxin [Chloroflexi bacterium]|nr:type II toxin-antitoxin system Phd/YefM family antitoxin [Chloroflexota bacterium]